MLTDEQINQAFEEGWALQQEKQAQPFDWGKLLEDPRMQAALAGGGLGLLGGTLGAGDPMTGLAAGLAGAAGAGGLAHYGQRGDLGADFRDWLSSVTTPGESPFGGGGGRERPRGPAGRRPQEAGGIPGGAFATVAPVYAARGALPLAQRNAEKFQQRQQKGTFYRESLGAHQKRLKGLEGQAAKMDPALQKMQANLRKTEGALKNLRAAKPKPGAGKGRGQLSREMAEWKKQMARATKVHQAAATKAKALETQLGATRSQAHFQRHGVHPSQEGILNRIKELGRGVGSVSPIPLGRSGLDQRLANQARAKARVESIKGLRERLAAFTGTRPLTRGAKVSPATHMSRGAGALAIAPELLNIYATEAWKPGQRRRLSHRYTPRAQGGRGMNPFYGAFEAGPLAAATLSEFFGGTVPETARGAQRSVFGE